MRQASAYKSVYAYAVPSCAMRATCYGRAHVPYHALRHVRAPLRSSPLCLRPMSIHFVRASSICCAMRYGALTCCCATLYVHVTRIRPSRHSADGFRMRGFAAAPEYTQDEASFAEDYDANGKEMAYHDAL